jgi:hypothetical protein
MALGEGRGGGAMKWLSKSSSPRRVWIQEETGACQKGMG